MEPYTLRSTRFAVMSYNRGPYLRNCVASIRAHAPEADIYIYDDSSTGRHTLETLSRLSNSCTVIRCQSTVDGDRGGLHSNMNLALDHAITAGVRYIHFVQDDMQFVRPGTGSYEDEVARSFASQQSVAQVETTFFRGYWPTSVLRKRYRADPKTPCYIPVAPDWHTGVTDTGIISVERLAAVGFRYSSTECASIAQSTTLGLTRVALWNPVLTYLPWPGRPERRSNAGTSLRTVVKRVLIDLQELISRAGCHPVNYLSPSEVSDLESRTISAYPIAEHYLRTHTRLRTPWWYSGCDDLSDFTHPWRLLTGAWLLHGPPHYRRNALLARNG